MNDKLATLATEAATAILTPLGFEFKLEAQPYEDSVQIMIESPDARFLIGEEGDRLDDLQYLVNRLVHNALAESPGIRTCSEETDSRFKRITISRAD